MNNVPVHSPGHTYAKRDLLVMLLTCRNSGKSVWYQNHVSALKGGTLVLKYSFTNVTGAASTALSEHTRSQFLLWQLGFMYIHTMGFLKESGQWYVYCQQVQGENLRRGKTVLFEYFDCADFMELNKNVMFARSSYFALNFATSNKSMLMKSSLLRETE